MKKEERLQVRVDAKQLEFLKEYAARRNITISRMMRDFIDWLIKRDTKQQEAQGGTSGTTQSTSN